MPESETIQQRAALAGGCPPCSAARPFNWRAFLSIAIPCAGLAAAAVWPW